MERRRIYIIKKRNQNILPAGITAASELFEATLTDLVCRMGAVIRKRPAVTGMIAAVLLLLALSLPWAVFSAQAKSLKQITSSSEPEIVPVNQSIKAHGTTDEAVMIRTEEPPYQWNDVVMLAKLVYSEARGVSGNYMGVTAKARQAAVIWCVLNRVDAAEWDDTILGVITEPNQFAYSEDAPFEMEYILLAEDVLQRWFLEKQGKTNVGRTLPQEFYYFGGDGVENYFRTEYESFLDVWDWKLADPYLGDKYE